MSTQLTVSKENKHEQMRAKMIKELSKLSFDRLQSAKAEGMTEEAAMEEIVAVIVNTYDEMYTQYMLGVYPTPDKAN